MEEEKDIAQQPISRPEEEKTGKEKRLFVLLLIFCMILAAVLIAFYFYSHDHHEYIEYGNEETLYTFKYPNTLTIYAELLESPQAWVNGSYKPYYVFDVNSLSTKSIPNFEFSESFLNSRFSDKKVLESKRIKVDGSDAFQYTYEEGDRKMSEIFILAKNPSDTITLPENDTYLIEIHYIFDENFDEKPLRVLLKSFKEKDLLRKISILEINRTLSKAKESIGKGDLGSAKIWYVEAEKLVSEWENKSVWNEQDTSLVSSMMNDKDFVSFKSGSP